MHNTERCFEATVIQNQIDGEHEPQVHAFNNYAEFVHWRHKSPFKFDDDSIDWIKSIHWQGGSSSFIKVFQFGSVEGYQEWCDAHQQLRVRALEIIWRIPKTLSREAVLSCDIEKKMVLDWIRRYKTATTKWCGERGYYDDGNNPIDEVSIGFTTPQGVTKILDAFAIAFNNTRWEWSELEMCPHMLDMTIDKAVREEWINIEIEERDDSNSVVSY